MILKRVFIAVLTPLCFSRANRNQRLLALYHFPQVGGMGSQGNDVLGNSSVTTGELLESVRQVLL